MSEFEIHKNIVKHLRYRGHPGTMIMHIPNNPRSGRHGKHLQAMGLLKGAPDMVYPLPDGRVVWHEIKAPKGRLEPEQKEVHWQLRDRNHIVLVTYGLDDALGQLRDRGLIR